MFFSPAQAQYPSRLSYFVHQDWVQLYPHSHQHRHPVLPTTYPVQTKQSKIGSLAFMCVLLVCLVYSLYLFIVENFAIIDAYVIKNSHSNYSTLPNLEMRLYQIDQLTGSINLINSSIYSLNLTAYVRLLGQHPHPPQEIIRS